MSEQHETGSVKLYVNGNLTKILLTVAASIIVVAVVWVGSNIQDIGKDMASLKTQVNRMDKQMDTQNIQLISRMDKQADQLQALDDSLKDAEIRWLTSGGPVDRR